MSNVIINKASLNYENDFIVSDSIELPYDVDYITISKYVKDLDSNYIVPNQTITFVVTITNQSQIDLMNILFDDDFDTSVWKYVEGTLKIDNVVREPMSIFPLTYNLDTLAVDNTSIIEFQLTLLESYDGDDGLVSNTVTVKHNGNEYQATASVLYARLLKIEKTTSHVGIVKPGDVIPFELHVTNPNKDREIHDILVIDDYDTTQWEYVDNTFKINGVPTTPASTQPLRATLYSINPGETIIIGFDLRVSNFI